jgi:hypothetical protein
VACYPGVIELLHMPNGAVGCWKEFGRVGVVWEMPRVSRKFGVIQLGYVRLRFSWNELLWTARPVAVPERVKFGAAVLIYPIVS